jgi:hypothetical protein
MTPPYPTGLWEQDSRAVKNSASCAHSSPVMTTAYTAYGIASGFLQAGMECCVAENSAMRTIETDFE